MSAVHTLPATGAHYSLKAPEEIRSRRIADHFIFELGCKAITLACNSAASATKDNPEKYFGLKTSYAAL